MGWARPKSNVAAADSKVNIIPSAIKYPTVVITPDTTVISTVEGCMIL